MNEKDAPLPPADVALCQDSSPVLGEWGEAWISAPTQPLDCAIHNPHYSPRDRGEITGQHGPQVGEKNDTCCLQLQISFL